MAALGNQPMNGDLNGGSTSVRVANAAHFKGHHLFILSACSKV
jgi:hypothetical protein